MTPAEDPTAAWKAGRETYGDLAYGFEQFEPEFRSHRERAAAAGRTPRRATERVVGSDLYLTVACDLGVDGAWEAFERAFVPRLKGLFQRRGIPVTLGEEILADLPGDLCTPPPRGGARTRIGSYDGTEDLFSWLAVVVLRRRADRVRTLTKMPWSAPFLAAAGEGSTGLTPAARMPTPSSTARDGERVKRFEETLQEALKDLTPKERLAVLMKFRDGLPQKQIARFLSVGEPRVSRLLQSGTERLRAYIRKRMKETPPGSTEEALWLGLEAAVAGQMASWDEDGDTPSGKE
jgi:RNA polymerase sigma factor (sigma-70 family)